MGRHEDGRPSPVDAVQETHDALRRGRVEVSGGFVGKKNQRSVDECPSHRHTLLLTTGELVREAVVLVAEPHELEYLRHLRLDDRLRPANHFEGEGDVLKHRLVGQEPEVLEHAADVAAQEGDSPLGEAADVATSLDDASLVRDLLTQQEPQEGRLARSRRTDEEDELPFVDVHRHVSERDGRGLVGLGDVFEADHRFVGRRALAPVL